jgi:hypothetical protein
LPDGGVRCCRRHGDIMITDIPDTHNTQALHTAVAAQQT